MEISDIVENDDGSYDIRLSLNAKEAEALINVGFNKLLLDLIEKQAKVPALLREKENGYECKQRPREVHGTCHRGF